MVRKGSSVRVRFRALGRAVLPGLCPLVRYLASGTLAPCRGGCGDGIQSTGRLVQCAAGRSDSSQVQLRSSRSGRSIAPAAFASLPTTKDKTIVPGVSVAGVKLGMSLSKAAKLWKDTEGDDNCFPGTPTETWCIFEIVGSSLNRNTGNISYTGKKKVERISIRAPFTAIEDPIFNSQMNKYKTKEGVRIGAPLGKLRSEFGKKLKRTGGAKAYSSYEARGPGKAITEFGLIGGKVERISLELP